MHNSPVMDEPLRRISSMGIFFIMLRTYNNFIGSWKKFESG